MFPKADFKIQNPINKVHGDTPFNSILSSCRGSFATTSWRRTGDKMTGYGDPYQVEMGSITLPSNGDASCWSCHLSCYLIVDLIVD